MEKKLGLPIMALLIAASGLCWAEEAESSPIAFVLSCRGGVEMKPADGTMYEILKPGAWLGPKAYIKTGDSSQVCLQYDDNQVVRIKGNQGYDVGARTGLERAKEATGIWGVIDRVINTAKGDMPAKAGVRSARPEPLVARMPRGGKIMGGELPLAWGGGIQAKTYTVCIAKDDGEVVWTRKVSGTSTALQLNHAPLQPGNSYSWYVNQEAVGTLAPASAKFYHLSQSEEKAARKAAKKFARENYRGLDDAAKHAAMANYYASKGLCVEAEREAKMAMARAENKEAFAVLLAGLHNQDFKQ